jgi:hypothetical protein
MKSRRGRVFVKPRDTFTEEEIAYIIIFRLKHIDEESIELATRLLRKVKILHDTGCWVTNEDWSEYRNFNHEAVHILSYRLFVGKIVKYILHHCDRKGCMNYTHLFQGSCSDNKKDWEVKKATYLKVRQIELLRRREQSPNGRVASGDKIIRSWREMANGRVRL